MSRRLRGSSWGVAALLAAGTLGCSGPAVEIPEPDTSSAEDVVQEALAVAVEEVRLDPASVAAWVALADRLHAHAWDVEAARCYERAEALEPTEFSWPYMRAVCLGDTDLAGSAEALARAVELDPGYAPARVRYGKVLMGLGRTDEAATEFEAATALDAGNPHAWLGRAQVAMARSEFDDARRWLERALEINPGIGEIHHMLAQTYLALGMEERIEAHTAAARRLPKETAMDDPRASREVPPVGSMANNDRGIALVRQGLDAEAASYFEEALRINPEFAEAHYNYGTLLAKSGRLDEAILHLEQAVRIGPPHADAQVNLGIALASRGEHERAAELYREALEIDPFHATAHVRLGASLEAAGDARGAVDSYRRALDAQPEWYEPAWRLAWILSTSPDPSLRDGAEAIRLAESACAATRFSHARALDALAAAYAEQGRFADAVTAARKAARLARDPELEARIRARVERFESGRPYRE